MPQNGTERPFSLICVHSCIPTAARATGRGPRVPRRRRPHSTRDAQVPGPEAHATGAVTQPSTHTSSRSLIYYRLFGGSCGLTPRPRCQPGSGAVRSEFVFPTRREGPARGRRRHAMVAEALAPPDAARVAIRIATRVATVYTNAPIRRGEAILANLCTLLRRRPGGEAHVAGAMTQPSTHTSSRILTYYPRNNVGVSHTLP